MSEVVTSVGFAAAGAAIGSLAVYLAGRKSRSREGGGRKSGGSFPSKIRGSDSIPRGQLEKSKRELRTLLLEKELVSAALTKLYEAEVSREITREEREILGAKYKTELRTLDEKISKMDAFVQIGDLETLRNQLVQLVSEKMDAIEKRIENTRKIAEPIIAEMLERPVVKPVVRSRDEKPRVPDISDMIQKPELVPPVAITNNAATPESSISIKNMEPISTDEPQNFVSKKSGEKVEELQKELLEALDRLEKLDVET